MHRHVSPGTAGGGEHHVAASALEHPRVVVRGQMSVEAAAAEYRVWIRTVFSQSMSSFWWWVGQPMLTNFPDPELDKNR